MCCDKYFSYRAGQCVADSNCTTECPDPCQNTDITSYANELNCRSFYECNDKKSKSICCADGQGFKNGTCVDDDLCTMPCPVDAVQLEIQQNTATTNQPSPNPSCSLEAVGAGQFQLIGNANKDHIMSCPGNLVFSVKKCTCDFPTKDVLDTLPRECKPEVCVDFEQKMNPVKVENYNNVTISGGRGHFNGDSYLAIPLYSYNERFSKRITIKVLFKSKPGKGQDRQVLISNCRTEISARGSRLSPSLAIIIDKSVGQNYVIFLGTTKNNGNASIAHTFQPNQWTGLELVFDGERLTASTNTIDYETGASIESQFDTKELTGELKVGLESLKIGKCLDRDGFHGEMDNVCIGDCLNGYFSGNPNA
ncbi:protein PIF-like [Pecten maximus]|uniref:protein PIF-like n=1 Tax=Pecten maximus TaxID=6579 RepID=UPI0014580EA8|nr:protein PIF-like [Pecten maximus]